MRAPISCGLIGAARSVLVGAAGAVARHATTAATTDTATPATSSSHAARMLTDADGC
jgi:hypothetical protein